MVEQRFWNLNLTGTPSAVSSTRLGPNGPNDNFVGVATLGAGSASAVVLGARITSESAIFLAPDADLYRRYIRPHVPRVHGHKFDFDRSFGRWLKGQYWRLHHHHDGRPGG